MTTNTVTPDFIFGTLATDDLRLAQVRAASAGVAHAHRIEPIDPAPGQPVLVYASLGPRVVADRVTCYYTTDGSEPHGQRGVASNGQALDLLRRTVEWDTLLWGYREVWTGHLPAQEAETLVRYRIEAWSTRGAESRWASEFAGMVAGERPADVSDEEAQMFAFGKRQLWPVRRAGSYAYHVDDECVPDWLRDAVIYHVFIDRFATTGGVPFETPETLSGLFGGTLRGVIERLEYISALGATCLWLSPLFPSPTHHGYDATDYGRVEPRLGSDADMRELIEQAHARGIRIILDYVVNHISSEHPVFLTAQTDQTSAEAQWFTFTRWPDVYLSFFGVQSMPQIDTDAAPARAYMIDHARYWLEQGVDGFRLDYANGPSHAFWSEFRAATRATKRDSVTLGEVVETAALQNSYTGRMDGCLDFLLLQAMRQFFAFNTMNVVDFDVFLRRHMAFFNDDYVLPSFLDNHDMNRFLWVAQGDVRRLRLAALCQFTLPHPPILYYGTEVGLSQQRDVRRPDGGGYPEESRLPMLWGAEQDRDLLAFYQQLVAARRETPDLWRRARRTLTADAASRLYVYACGDGAREAIVALNNDPTEQQVTLPSATCRLALTTSAEVTLTGDTLTLPPLTGALLRA